jgi:hypothetical protein
MSSRICLLFAICIFTGNAVGQENSPLPFKIWKDQQITEARNQVVRISNRRTLAKASAKSSENEPDHSRTVSSEEISTQQHVQRPSNLETDLQQANENLESAKELSFEDYVTVYLAAYKNRPEVLAGISQRLTKEEVAALLSLVLNRNRIQETRSAAKPFVDGLLAGDRSR